MMRVMLMMVSGLMLVVRLLLGTAAAPADDPETVMITFQPKAGMEEELKKAIASHWVTVQKLGLARAEPHVTLETRDEARHPAFIEIFTWRDRDIPDNAPQAILTIWSEMNRLTAPRNGRPGLDVKEVKLASGVQ